MRIINSKDIGCLTSKETKGKFEKTDVMVSPKCLCDLGTFIFMKFLQVS